MFNTKGVLVESVGGQGFAAYVSEVRKWFKDHPELEVLQIQTAQENTESAKQRFSVMIICRPVDKK